MLIATLNTWKNDGKYRERVNLCKQESKILNPDILLIQEDFSTEDGEVHTARAIATAMGKKYYTCKARIKERVFEGKDVLSSAGLAIISDLVCLQELEIALPTNDLDGGRNAQVVRFKINNHELVVVNLHLTHLRGATALRLAQIDEILNQDEVALADDVILVGDFNAPYESEEVQYLVNLGFHDCFSTCLETPGGTSPLKNNQRVRIDFILLKSKNIICGNPAIVYDAYDSTADTYPSDHLGVSTHLELITG